ncbi:SDR family NAD(P)-dependent oxidoreductase [Salinarimonas chemoclinalis]|uniref:SDR family NAD(P)-dependent oxidoreductase n=1 Tax=Salinarimonas chemoclinalis TaxID=3241599 RepID=UPI00355664AC
MLDLTNKTILLTGAAKGIGAATAKALGAAGAHVIAHYGGDRAGAEAATAEIPAERRLLLQADFSDPASADGLFREALAWRGRIDVLVNNAAVMLSGGGIDADMDAWDETWARTLAINVLAPARLLKHAVAHYRDAGGGTIVTISSWAAQRGSTNADHIAYAASKAAIKAASHTLARACAKENILVYVVAPGVVRTKMSEDFAAAMGGEAPVTAGLAMGEWVPPEDIANLVAFLATGASRHLSGATLDVNGASYVR